MSESKSPFRHRLEAAVAARHSRMNPFTEKWVKGELTRAQFGSWASQHYQYVSHSPAGARPCTPSARTWTPGTSCSRTSLKKRRE